MEIEQRQTENHSQPVVHRFHGIEAAEHGADRLQMEQEGESRDDQQDAASGEYPVIQDLANT